MKETIVFVATIFMEFNSEDVCNAFYKNYDSTNGHIATCSKVIRFNDTQNLRVGHLDDLMPPPLPRPVFK